MKFDIWKKSIDNIEKEMALKYFKLSEFESPDLPNVNNMCPKFLKKLDKARAIAGIPFFITSGYRSPQHNVRCWRSTRFSTYIDTLQSSRYSL